MPRFAVLAVAALVAFAPPALAQGVFIDPPPSVSRPNSDGLTGVRAHVQNQLPVWGFRNVDVRDLSLSQVVQINSAIHSSRSLADIRGKISSILRRGGAQRIVDRIIGQ